jgi:thioredoxin 1
MTENITRIEIERGDVLVPGNLELVKFGADWCKWCVKTAPDYEKVSKHFADSTEVFISEYNVDNHREWVKEKFGLKEIPTLLFFKDGVEVDRWTADEITYDNIVKKVEELLV